MSKISNFETKYVDLRTLLNPKVSDPKIETPRKRVGDNNSQKVSVPVRVPHRSIGEYTVVKFKSLKGMVGLKSKSDFLDNYIQFPTHPDENFEAKFDSTQSLND